MTPGTAWPWLSRTAVRLVPDPSRVLARLFLPGQEMMGTGDSRAAAVVGRILAMTEQEVAAQLKLTRDGFDGRHRDLTSTLQAHFDLLAHRLSGGDDLSPDRQLLMGAYFTNEQAVEAAAFCNPSMVLHPDQSGLAAGEARFVMSVRAVGEGHISSIEFRTGVAGPGADVRVDDPGPFVVGGAIRPPLYDRSVFEGKLAEKEGLDGIDFVLAALPEHFSDADLGDAIAALEQQALTRRSAPETVERLLWVAASNYDVEFPADSALAERLLAPVGPAEIHGMEDARFVRFTDDSGLITYYATYTAYDGSNVTSHLIETGDFSCFRITPLSGPATGNKGMALFPRKIAGRYAALSRWDRENNAVVFSDDCRSWGTATTLQSPSEPWELLQIGNCGSPIETPEGWLVLTHGVGPLRVYSIGAILLDLEDPTVVRARLREPVLAPGDERDGYVPNVVYSCGAMLHAGSLVIPYGVGDQIVRVVVVELAGLLDELLGGSGQG